MKFKGSMWVNASTHAETLAVQCQGLVRYSQPLNGGVWHLVCGQEKGRSHSKSPRKIRGRVLTLPNQGISSA